MHRRSFIRNTIGTGIAMQSTIRSWSKFNLTSGFNLNGPSKPVFVYNNWSAYDELSDNVPQTEELAMRELDEILRLKKAGVEIDYYVMDAFWFDKWGGYREWHKQHWPNGPGKWLNLCEKNNIKPGMWFSTNLIATQAGRFLEVIHEWKDSLATDPNIMCLFDGGYLKHLAGTLQMWYDKGVRLFKFDFAYFEAVTPAESKKYSKEQVIEKNKVAFMTMLKQFRKKNPDVLITGYNGFGGDMENTFTPFNKTIDPRWLETFDTLYSGDPRFSDVPMMNIWRSQDNYSDHQVNAFKAYGMPGRRIDNCAFMIGKTGTCYYRGNHCWKGMLILELARGGWLNVYHGNLELLSEDDAHWFAKTQSMYRPLQRRDTTTTFGGIPGKGKPYGFKSSTSQGIVCTVVNPSQELATIRLPAETAGQLLYADGGYQPQVRGQDIALGAEQLAVVGFGEFANEKYILGTDSTINIPNVIEKLQSAFVPSGKNVIEGSVKADGHGDVRIIFQQFDAQGLPFRSWPGAPPSGKKVNEVIQINAWQGDKSIPLYIEYDKIIWSGLSWGAAEIMKDSFNPAESLSIKCSSTEQNELKLHADVYRVSYKS